MNVSDPGRPRGARAALIVVDASAILELLLNTAAGGRIAHRVLSEDSLHAPHILDLEVAQVLRRYFLAGELSAERGDQAVEDLLDLPVTRYPHELFLVRIWDLRRNVTAYDAAYIALAEAFDAPLITRDARLAASSGHRARVERV